MPQPIVAPTTSDSDQGSVTVRYATFVLISLTVLNLLNYTDRFIFAALIPYIQEDTHFTDQQFGLIGSAFTWIYTVCAPLFGYFGDRYHRGKLIAIGISIWSLATAAAGISRSFMQLLVSRSAVGIGEANYATIAPGLLSDFFTKERRGLAMSIFMAAIPIGTAVGYLVGGFFGKPSQLGWRHTLFLVGLPGLVAALIMFFIREPVRGAMDKNQVDEPQPSGDQSPHSQFQADSPAPGFVQYLPSPLRLLWNVFQKDYFPLLTNRGYMLACLGYAAVTFSVGALVYWAPKWMTNDKGITAQEANNVLGVCAVFGGAIGTIIGGIVGDRLQKRVRGAYLWICAISAALSAIPTVVAVMSPDKMVYQTSIFIAITILFLGNGPINTALVNLVPPTLRTTALGLVVVIIHVLGDGISLSLVGAISTWIQHMAAQGQAFPAIVTLVAQIFHLNPATQSLSVALVLMPLGMVFGGFLYWLGLHTPEGKKL